MGDVRLVRARELIPALDDERAGATQIAIVDGSLAELVAALLANPRVAHVISSGLLATSEARERLAELAERMVLGPELTPSVHAGVGRAALFTSSERRAARLERVAELFASQHVRAKAIQTLSDIAEELMTNALYDAPREAGCFTSAIARTAAVELRPEQACEISYGLAGSRAFVRVRDPFGALTKQRLLQVLDRCRHKNVPLDESRGGAGLGMWRVFSNASTVVIAVIPGRLTDILVYVDPAARRGASLQAVQLMFPDEFALDGVPSRFAAEHDSDLLDDSFTALVP